jgi:Ca2+-binding EF-hand superfamily protein
MKKLVLGLSAMALMASAATFANDEDDTRIAAAEGSSAAFTKLDADADGRISAIEAANNSKVAAGFTTSDADKDGYLSKAEYAQMARSSSDSGASTPRSSSSSMPEPSTPSDTSETAPTPR